MAGNGIRVLIADHNTTTSKKLGTYLTDSGFSVAVVNDGSWVASKILDFRPNFILIDLMLPDFTALQCLDFLRDKEINDDVRVLVLSLHNAKQNVEQCMQAGAYDYMVKPFTPIDVLTRLALHVQARKRLKQIEEIQDKDAKQINYYLQLVELLVKTTRVPAIPHQIHFQLLRMLSLSMNAVRISLIKCDPAPMVIASGDNEKFTHFPLQIEKYPEIDYVMRTHRPVFIESLKDDGMMSFVKEHLKTVHFNSMIVIPIMEENRCVGILSARMAESINLIDADIRMCQIVAQIISNFWHSQALLQTKSAS